MLSDEQRRVALSALRPDESLEVLAAAGAGTAEEIRANLRRASREKADVGPTEVRTRLKGSAEIVRDGRGSSTSTWTWGAPHMPLRPHEGGAGTLASAFYLPPGTFETRLGPNYRLLASLGDDRATRSICRPGQSGQPGSPHYADQVAPYHADQHATVQFTWSDVEAEAEALTRLLSEVA